MTLPGILMPGATLGRYELLMPIAQGGMAAVWAARQVGSRGFEKTVAIKTMLPKLSDDPQFERMFLNEASLATRIQHPNVAQILDLGEHGELVYMVMEWVDGEALSTVMRAADQAGTSIARDLAVGILERACWGLHAAHEVTNENDENAGIVHRDVSPQNILVAYNGAVKVVDFGVAKAPGLQGGETNTGSLKGKVPFMSPEQAQCGPMDRRTDVFAIGVMLYRMTTGTHPFVGTNDIDTLHNIISVEPVPPRQRDASISPELERIILTCLAKDKRARFASMADLAHALGAASRRVNEQEIAQCIATFMGPKGAQRRAQLKNAARSLGWAVQTSDQMPQIGMPTPSHPSGPGGHPSHPQLTPSGQRMPGTFTPSNPLPQGHYSDAQGRTFAAVASGQPTKKEGGMSTGVVVAIAALAIGVVASLAGLGIVMTRQRGDARGPSTAQANEATAPTATAASTGDAKPEKSAVPVTAVSVAVSATASAAPSALVATATASATTDHAGAPQTGQGTKPPVKPGVTSGAGEPDMGF